jgi:hypothetical protein
MRFLGLKVIDVLILWPGWQDDDLPDLQAERASDLEILGSRLKAMSPASDVRFHWLTSAKGLGISDVDAW